MSEEQKAIKKLEKITNDYTLNSEDLHYAIVLYHLIINLQQENARLKEKNSIYKSAIKGQMKKIEELKKGRRISKVIHKERNRKLKEEKQELKNKITLLNTMNENNYNNYCELPNVIYDLIKDGLVEKVED